ncbi:type I 3-dehydroquinate dehydratase [Thermovibrio ammonificans]
MLLGTVKLGEVPRVIVALNGKNLKENLERARRLRIDLVEARLDLLEEVKPETVREFLDTVADYGFYAVTTLRPVWEGGRFEGSEEERLKLLELAVNHPATAAVDVELRSKLTEPVRQITKEAGKKLIVSYHDFEKTPREEEIEELFKACLKKQADIVKLAFAGKTHADAARVCCTLSKFKEPKVFMVMGEAGKFTRVVGFSFGSLLTYTFFGRPVAPGQIEAEELVRLISDFYPDYAKEKLKLQAEPVI